MPETPPTSTSSLRGRRPRTRMSTVRCCPRPCRNSLKAGPITDRWLASAMRVAASRTRHLAVFQSERLKWSLHPFRPYGTGRSRPRQGRRRDFPLHLSLRFSISSTYLPMCLHGMVFLAQGVWLSLGMLSLENHRVVLFALQFNVISLGRLLNDISFCTNTVVVYSASLHSPCLNYARLLTWSGLSTVLW